jgi:hypothetical protein
MPNFSATVQYKETRAQFTISSIPRKDGKGNTMFGIKARSFDDAMTKALAMYNAKVKEFNKGVGLILIEPGTEDFVLLHQEGGQFQTRPFPHE